MIKIVKQAIKATDCNYDHLRLKVFIDKRKGILNDNSNR